ncbi:MAG: nucleoside phosphorylase [Chitinophagales bacterium]
MRKAESELILNSDGSIYHLNLKKEDVATTIITVGDPERVQHVSKHFDNIELKKTKREFEIHTGNIGSKRITVLSTGMGTDNIDIVFNELDALFNIDFSTRTICDNLTSLDIIRIGTSGAIQPDIPIDSFLATETAIGLDGLMGFYSTKNNAQHQTYLQTIQPIVENLGVKPSVSIASEKLLTQLAADMPKGITLTNAGFYAPQGRSLRLTPTHKNYIDECAALVFDDGKRITNMEMETSGIYGLSNLLGHHAISLNAILANRANGTFSADANKTVNRLIELTLERIVANSNT